MKSIHQFLITSLWGSTIRNKQKFMFQKMERRIDEREKKKSSTKSIENNFTHVRFGVLFPRALPDI